MAPVLMLTRKRALGIAAGTIVLGTGWQLYSVNKPVFPPPPPGGRPPPPWTPPSRQKMLSSLRANVPVRALEEDVESKGDEEFDLLIVGGGATGSGVAVDAASRGLKVALVERDDFSSGTSSKSTKLVHGGVRYLQKAVLELDYEQYKLVREALHERRIFLQTAPYLSHMLPIMLPLYKWWQLPYYWAGCKAYDFLAGGENMESSYVMTKGKALEAFPMLKSEGLVGALVYYDGQHNDARMNVSLIMTAVQHGATVINHVEATELHKNEATGKLNGARVRDRLTGEEINVRAKGIINATGPFSDSLLQMDAAISGLTPPKPIVAPSSGVHVTLPNYYSPRKMGLLDPATSDGRVIFFLPWQGNTIAGTTDTPTSVTDMPIPREEEIEWILEEIKRYLSPDIRVRRGDVLSAWSGLRPLIRDPNSSNSKDLVRNHLITVSGSGLITIAGGKWTTYRAMAQETVDKAAEVFGFDVGSSITERVRLVGSENWSKNMFIGLVQRYGLETEVAKHLSDNYGDRAWAVASMAESAGRRWPLHGIRLNPNYPYIEAEIYYAVRNEYAQTAVDFIGRRSRLAFLNAAAALDALPRVIDIMGNELGWNANRRKKEWVDAREYLVTMGLPPPSPGEIEKADLDVRGRGWYDLTLGGTRGGGGFLGRFTRLGSGIGEADHSSLLHSRAHFSLDELEALRLAWVARGGDEETGAGIRPTDVVEISRGEAKFIAPSGKAVELKDVVSAMVSAGIEKAKNSLSFDEFVDTAASMKDTLTAKRKGVKLSARDAERRVIPVEKSGGGL
ncbi:FAD dependent oxidoreductase-domain-containing protein [Cantharellus anzutake]|uniref:FAD dependent oxidoreductase-domain-containing protein n=1 Tax=Cantharellus anzutake TaxID=1750568 RepID=UPI00190503A5|nr:FAD dependent oxidoreductase-domain-containing protein [Cantharellus anzutake]KAF8321962.1 FAD dependent oxidoreductase-domain-containing protein [Cantharellus anzutake]